MKMLQNQKIFYVAMWFNRDNSNHPIVRGYNAEETIDKLLEITKDKDGCVEVYQITYNELGFKINLYKKFEVLDKFKLCESLIERV